MLKRMEMYAVYTYVVVFNFYLSFILFYLFCGLPSNENCREEHKKSTNITIVSVYLC